LPTLASFRKQIILKLKHIVALLLLTGCRVSELLHAEWKHVDLNRRAWLIPTSKTGTSRYVPLSQAAIDVLGALRQFDGCPFVLPNPETRQPFVSIKHAWQTARKAAKLYDLRIHDLRHSAASFMINAGVDLYTVGKVLGHADHQSTMRYAHLANETLLAAVEAGAAGLSGQNTT
jgi:integrase